MTPPLSLAFALLDYFPYGGQQRDFLKIATAAVAAGHRVTALVHSWEGDVPAGIAVVRLPTSGFSNHRRLQRFADNVLAWRNQQPVDALIGFFRMPGLDLYFAADPCYRARALERRGFWVRLLSRFRVLSKMEAAVFSPTSHTDILVLTASEAGVYQDCYDTPDSRFTLLPPGVADEFTPIPYAERSALRQHFDINTDTVLMLMVGSHFLTKGVDRSLQALATLTPAERQHCQLWIAGTGKQRKMLALAARLGLLAQVRFLGGRGDVAQLMQAADILLQPSRTELAGMTIVEALSSDLPVIASGECGYAAHVSNAHAGIALTKPFSVPAFAAAIRQALDVRIRLDWRQAAHQYASMTDLHGLAAVALIAIERNVSTRKRKSRQ